VDKSGKVSKVLLVGEVGKVGTCMSVKLEENDEIPVGSMEVYFELRGVVGIHVSVSISLSLALLYTLHTHTCERQSVSQSSQSI
jgi:hypothetical protein